MGHGRAREEVRSETSVTVRSIGRQCQRYGAAIISRTVRSDYQLAFGGGEGNLRLRPGIEVEAIGFDAVAENHAIGEAPHLLGSRERSTRSRSYFDNLDAHF